MEQMENKLEELAVRCEQATGPDRELDVAIHTTVTSFEPRRAGVGWPKGALIVPAFPGWQVLPAYTASLGAAMTLVPEGWRPVIDTASEEGAALVDIWAWVTVSPKPKRRHAKAATPALALCAAALRARVQGHSS
jgi:hypothetical protein